ncbi:hypothetical protein QBC36DRAFT_358820 [Triangularia setosa]|uniref:Uncharacterized protein n=1 Tax=Triangularia setosa TaxID=2587417 RepID=A0AAN7ABZ0_9PEZI|nr:hypothetical protein QBC36DRAFT_358820 [Podospora setosa]
MDSTPLRRVPLSSIDPNTTTNTNNNTNASSFTLGSSSPTKRMMMMMQSPPLQKAGQTQQQTMQTRTPPETEVKKRSLGMGVQSSPTMSRVGVMPPQQVGEEEESEERVAKKPRLSYSRSPSPAPSHTSSVFSSPPVSTNTNNHDTTNNENDDTNENDISQATTLTLPDLPPVAPVGEQPPPITGRRLTREQARQKAEILRLRLSLANYKVKTGQTDVSLDQLERRQMLQQWGQQGQVQPQRSSYQQQHRQQHQRQHSQEMMQPPRRQVTHKRSSSGAGAAGFVTSGNTGNGREGLWEVMRRREVERLQRQERGVEVEGEETEEEGELELPRLPQKDRRVGLQEGDNRGVEAVSGLLSLARG